MKHTTISRLIGTLAAVSLLAGCDDHYDVGPPPVAAMDWILYDSCADGLGLQAALFDFSHDEVWPSPNGVYLTGPGGAIEARIFCEVDAQICYGAETDPPSDIYWGVGIDGLDSCADCCEPCDDVVVEFELLCGPGAVGNGKAAAAKPKVSSSPGETKSAQKP